MTAGSLVDLLLLGKPLSYVRAVVYRVSQCGLFASVRFGSRVRIVRTDYSPYDDSVWIVRRVVK